MKCLQGIALQNWNLWFHVPKSVTISPIQSESLEGTEAFHMAPQQTQSLLSQFSTSLANANLFWHRRAGSEILLYLTLLLSTSQINREAWNLNYFQSSKRSQKWIFFSSLFTSLNTLFLSIQSQNHGNQPLT